MQKAQSAIEFLSTYSFVFLILAVALALLLLFASIPKSTIPFECSFYSGFSCVDAAYYNTSSGAQLVIVGTDMQPGTVNISAFSAYLNYYQSTGGYCTPRLLAAGQSFYCVANFAGSPTLGNTYTGTFQLTAKYCAGAPGSLSSLNCTATTAITYGGAVQLQASLYSPSFFSNLPYPPDIFCIGGNNNNAYYAPISRAGVGSWTSTNSYPSGVQLQNAGCSIYGSYIYCVGSNNGQQNLAYYSPITANGIGTWTVTTNSPDKMSSAGCSVYQSHIYCVGGNSGNEGAYYASVSSNGIGNWIYAGGYPIQFKNAGCSTYKGYIYCVGSNTGGKNQVYYAPIMSRGGIGTWTATTNYPTQLSNAGCSIYEGYIYCVGSQSGPQNYVYYAPVSSVGVGNWIAGTSYPIQFSNAGCAVFEGYLYCVGSNLGPTTRYIMLRY